MLCHILVEILESTPKRGRAMTFDAVKAAHFVDLAHRKRENYANLPPALAPRSIDDSYAAQEALAKLWEADRGPVAGLKIATTTKIMQELMGIDHPCGGMIFAKRIHASPANIVRADFINLVIECELAVRLGRDLPSADEPYDRGSVRSAVAAVMPAFELIEDRRAVYKETRAQSLIADNAWNGGIVLGAEHAPPADLDLNGLTGSLAINGASARTGMTDDPMGALAWVANLAATRRRPLKAGMVVITGSVIPTLPISPGETFAFTLGPFGSVTMTTC
jgi:2-keto-4-pentenoate hydratase